MRGRGLALLIVAALGLLGGAACRQVPSPAATAARPPTPVPPTATAQATVAAPQPRPVEVTFKSPQDITEERVEALWTDSQALATFLRDYGPAVTVQRIAESARARDADCHQLAHVVGRRAYELFGAQALALLSHECHSGAIHGATERYFQERGAGHLKEELPRLCADTLNTFFRHQCVHGIGHGLMAWYKYELLEVLRACDALEREADRGSCHSGAFMENVVGGLSGAMGPPTKYLSEDPHYPCNVLMPQYQGGCYFYQTSRMVSLFQGDFGRVAQACGDAPAAVQPLCYASMGRDVGGATRGRPEEAIRLCGSAADPQHRRLCLTGAVQDSFWDTGGAEVALRFCRLLSAPDDKAACYATILDRARELYTDRAAHEMFCQGVEEAYRPRRPVGPGQAPC